MYLGLYWFEREQNVSSTTRTVLQVLYVFQKLDSEIFTKYRLILSPSKSYYFALNDNIDVTFNELLPVVLDRFRKDEKLKSISHDHVSELGFRFSFLTDNPNKYRHALSFLLGVKESYIPNSLLYNYNLDYGKDFNWFRNLLIELLTIVSPVKWGGVIDPRFRDDIAQHNSNEYFIGWLNYFSNKIELPPIPTDKYIIEPFRDEGKIIATTQELWDRNNPEIVSKAMELVSLFRQNNIIR